MSCLAICCFVSSGYAQEQLSSIGYYPAQKRGPAPSLKSDHLLQLPFIDDFSSTKIYPNGQQWMDNQVYINNSFGKLTLGYGIATLDALDSTGAIYSHANISGFDADQLTSQPIDLDLGADTSVYLSFYYQPQGYGDAPEAQDSLILEFFAPQTNKWVWIWSTPGSPGHDFRQVMIPVRGAIFMQQGFQFRFKNRASLANAYEPSLKSNADHWHLDYVYLNNK